MMMMMIHPPYDPESPLSSPPDVNVVAVDDDGDDAVDEKTTWCPKGNYCHDPAAATRRCSSFNSTFSSLSSHQNTNTNNDSSPAAAATATLLCFNAPSWRWRGNHICLLKLTKKKRKQPGSDGSTAESAPSMAAAAAARDEDLPINVLLGNVSLLHQHAVKVGVLHGISGFLIIFCCFLPRNNGWKLSPLANLLCFCLCVVDNYLIFENSSSH